MTEDVKNIYKKLSEIQSELHAPKNQRNNFGNYNYRSCEDIVEAVKPILKEQKAVLLLSDTMKEIGGRVYVEALATLTCIEDDSMVGVTGQAREAESRKGMDDSQLTGATSSYARKYALNGLFAIDDTKDADSTNKHGKEEKKEEKKEEAKDDSLQPFLVKVKEGKEVIGENNYKKALDEYNVDKADKISPEHRQNFITFMRTFKEGK